MKIVRIASIRMRKKERTFAVNFHRLLSNVPILQSYIYIRKLLCLRIAQCREQLLHVFCECPFRGFRPVHENNALIAVRDGENYVL